ncbi:restriction endonuclease [Clostridium botulinum]|nr:restriction endonuclease [Clostridium botulinum]NFP02353.1 restriction endonuclease [Clostridium botulinum]
MASKYTYSEIIYNKKLGLSKKILAQSYMELNLKITEQKNKWIEQEKIEKLRIDADRRTQKAVLEINKYKNILIESLNMSHVIDIESLKKKNIFYEFTFNKEVPNIEDIRLEIGVPNKDFWELIFNSKKNKRIELENKALEIYNKKLEEYNRQLEESKEVYNKSKSNHEIKLKQFNESIDKFKEDLFNGEEYAVEKYLKLVLKKSKYSANIKREYEIQYDSFNKVIVISYELPQRKQIPSILEHKFIKNQKCISIVNIKEKEFNQYYEDILYKICLRNIYEVFESLKIKEINAVVFNGWIKGIDIKTGNDYHACIMSLQANREEFSNLKLERVSPKECFKNLKGISAGPLSELAPIRPILDLNRNDSRFVTPIEVLNNLEEGTNLAEMDWEDFEHLVRELFEKIFSGENCEVKVTQASRDCGVDAIAFDPDVIRGGRFVIQAKRYNNVVPTSAVRDLYGTMMAEGANKGILVTTSYFGKDSMEFAKEKPITLIDGARLLYMFKDHGYNLKIKLKNKRKKIN